MGWMQMMMKVKGKKKKGKLRVGLDTVRLVYTVTLLSY